MDMRSRGVLVPHVDQNCRVRRYKIPSVLGVRSVRMSDAKRADVIPSKYLFHDSIYVWELVTICEVGKATRSNNGVQFSLSFSLHFRKQRHRDEKVAKCAVHLRIMK